MRVRIALFFANIWCHQIFEFGCVLFLFLFFGVFVFLVVVFILAILVSVVVSHCCFNLKFPNDKQY